MPALVLDLDLVCDEEHMNDWTIMVYISADDVLANFAVESLKQLKRAAGDGIAVAAQFDANNTRYVRRLALRGTGRKDSSLENKTTKVKSIRRPVNMTAPRTLTKFVDWARMHYKAKHYCLILWGHGYELLLDQDQGRKASGRRYLTPANLREALTNTQLLKSKKKLDIIGLDACSMSLVELASELQSCVDFMVASQEDVPDASFPYEHVLLSLRGRERDDRDDVEGISTAIPRLYKQAYQDYLIAPGTGMKEITLSSLRLKGIPTVTDSIKGLAKALLDSASDPRQRRAILDARQATRDFSFGLFVDLFDFCEQLSRKRGLSHELKSACTRVCKATNKGDCVIENQTGEEKGKRCHGLSIYFPYLTDGEDERGQKSLVTVRADFIDRLQLVKGGTNILQKGGTNILRKERAGKIGELEEDFKLLDKFGETGWNKFIAHGWSFILAKELPKGELDLRYSAQQAALNLLSLCEESIPRVRPRVTNKSMRLQLVSRSTKKSARPPRKPESKAS